MAELLVAFALGVLMAWAFSAFARSVAFGGHRIGSGTRQRWLAKQDYESLLRTKKQIDDEIAKRQP